MNAAIRNPQYDRFIEDRNRANSGDDVHHQDRPNAAHIDLTDQDASADSKSKQQTLVSNIEGCALITANIISLIWGLTCYDLSSMVGQGATSMNLVFIPAIFSMIIALTFSVALTAFIYLIGFVIQNRFRGTLIGCCPVFLFLVLYVEYGIIIHQGLHLLLGHKEKLSGSQVSFIIFQIVVGVIIYALSLYRMLCDKRLISPHLTELEKETYEINENEIKGIRAEIQLAKQKKNIEMTQAHNNSINVPLTQVQFVQ